MPFHDTNDVLIRGTAPASLPSGSCGLRVMLRGGGVDRFPFLVNPMPL